MSRPPHGLFRVRVILPLALSIAVALQALSAPSITKAQPSSPRPSVHVSAKTMRTVATSHANPLMAPRWGTFSGTGGWTWDPVYQAYLQATGYRKLMLKRIATRPLVHWFGPWNPIYKLTSLTREYIAAMTLNGRYPDT